MGFRFYKSVGLGKGVRLNLSKTGIGVSAGVPGARVSMHSSGRRTRTVGLPGTGLYYRTDSYAGRSGSKGPRRQSSAVVPQQGPPAPIRLKAGLFASKSERRFIEGVTKYLAGDPAGALPLFAQSAERDNEGAHIAEEFFLGMCLTAQDRFSEAIGPFETVVASSQALPDQLMTKHGIEGEMQIQVTPEVRVSLPISSLGAALMLAELYQRTDQGQRAVELLESLGSVDAVPIFALSLAELYAADKRWGEVIRVGDGFDANDDDPTLALLVLRARAMRAQGLADACLAVCKEALRFRKRDPALLRAARYERALALRELGRKAQARKELERIYGEDPGFADVASLVTEMKEAAR